MPEKHRHHYVPQFYLRRFSSDGRSICLLNLKKDLLIRTASIRGQCYRDKFYGPTPLLENALMGLEGHSAGLIANLERGIIPPYGDHDWIRLMYFLALQHLRTARAARRLGDRSEAWILSASKRNPRFKDIDFSKIRVQLDHPVIFSMSVAPEVAWCFDDLQPIILEAPPNSHFLTSDSPIALYNIWQQGPAGTRISAAPLSGGLILFFPLSPSRCLLLLDAVPYKPLVRGSTLRVSQRDVFNINRLQATFCDENVYFPTAMSDANVREIIADSMRHRSSVDFHTIEYDSSDGADESTTVVTIDRVPNIALRLSFITVRMHFHRFPPKDRWLIVRKRDDDLKGPFARPMPRIRFDARPREE